jgi:hypothetical protein
MEKELKIAEDIINKVENNIDISHEPLLDKEVEKIFDICENTEVKDEVTKVLKHRDMMKINTEVMFSGNPYIVVNRKGRKLDIKQNFSIGVIYEKVNIEDLKLKNE